jgi:SAM-dependent methyltransferase
MNRLSEHWKHADLPAKQLQLNIVELRGKHSYPSHWVAFIDAMNSISSDDLTLYDIGCGTGSTYKLLADNNIRTKYVGLDFSEAMIQTARETWPNVEFYVDDFTNTKLTFKGQIVYCNGLLDILYDGIGALNTILQFGARYVILNRLNFSDKQNVETYVAYGTIPCIRYTFCRSDFEAAVRDNKYQIMSDGSSCLVLEKSDEV